MTNIGQEPKDTIGQSPHGASRPCSAANCESFSWCAKRLRKIQPTAEPQCWSTKQPSGVRNRQHYFISACSRPQIVVEERTVSVSIFDGLNGRSSSLKWDARRSDDDNVVECRQCSDHVTYRAAAGSQISTFQHVVWTSSTSKLPSFDDLVYFLPHRGDILAHVMSIDVNWGAATSGPDGEALAERIRSFIHDKFQQVALPRFIRSVQVHSFDFGTIPPDLEIKDFCEPFTDFYEEDSDDDEVSDISEELVSEPESQWRRTSSGHSEPPFRDELAMNHPLRDPFDEEYQQPSPLRSPRPLGEHLNHHFLPRSGTPGIPGGTSTLGYHLMSLGGLSGTQTPLAAVAGGTPFANGWTEPGSKGRLPTQRRAEPDIDTSNSASRPSTANTLPSHPSGHSDSGEAAGNNPTSTSRQGKDDDEPLDPSTPGHPLRLPRMRERKPEDFQVLCHAKYAGDIRLSLTAEILLDYPMPSFVGLPLKLNVTGLTFDGVAVVAYIRKRVHFCFLSAEDADALIGSDQPDNPANNEPYSSQKRQGGLLQEIRVESEIGRKEDGKQVLKNVGKVERFVLAQVRRIFEEELVYPSFWTFLV